MYSSETREVILNVLEYFQSQKENSCDMVSAIKLTATACKISERTIKRIRMESRTGTSLKVTRDRQAPKTRNMPETKKSQIRNIIYDMVSQKTYVTRQKLKEELHVKQILEISKTSLGILMREMGFKFKKDSNRRYIMETANITSKRAIFLRQYMENMTSDSPLDVVFLDETWVFQNGSDIRTWHDDSLKSVFDKRQGDGKRYVVLNAGSKDGFIDGAGLIFSTKNKSADYHDNMNSQMFEKWLEEQLLPRLEKPSLIVMDNARYHSRLSENVPNSSTGKGELVFWLQKKNIQFSHNALKPELLGLVQKYKSKLQYAVDELALRMGHKVLRLPPYHCIFNPIELVWAQCKTLYNKEIIGKDRRDENAVLEIWCRAMESVTAGNWADCVRHTEDIIRNYWEREKILYANVAPLIINTEETSSESDMESDSDSES